MALFSLATVLVSIAQWSVIRTQLADTRQTVQLDERPWLDLGQVESEPLPIDPSQPAPKTIGYLFRLHLRNTGKTAAYDIELRHITSLIGRGWNIREVMNSSLQLNLFGARDSTGKPIKPAATRDDMVPRYLGPGAISAPFIAIGYEPEPHPELPTMKMGGIALANETVYAFEGVVRYTDTFKVQHWAVFCVMVVKGGKLLNCVSGNDADRNF